jgi:hypothetical protein
MNYSLQRLHYLSRHSIEFQISNNYRLTVIGREELSREQIILLDKIFEDIGMTDYELLIDLKNMSSPRDFGGNEALYS